MKTNVKRLAILLVVAFSLLVGELSAGGSIGVKFGCWPWWWSQKRFWAYTQVKAFNWVLASNYNEHCIQANSSTVVWPFAGAWATCGFYGYGVGSWSWWWFASAGDGYTAPDTAPDDSTGYGKSDFTQDITLDASVGTAGLIKIRNIAGSLGSYQASNYGATYRIIVWESRDTEENHADCAPDHTDREAITANKIVWEAGVYINNGAVEYTGHFSPSEFSSEVRNTSYTNPSDASKTLDGPALKVSPASSAGLTKNIDIAQLIAALQDDPGQYDGNLDGLRIVNLVVSIESHTGYGSYTDPYGYNPDFGSKPVATFLKSNVATAFNFNVFPNPAKTTLNINVAPNTTEGSSEIKIFDSKGSLIKVIPQNDRIQTTYTIDVADLPEGLYKVVLFRNGAVYTKSFVH